MFQINSKGTFFVFVVNFKHVSDLFIVFLLLSLNRYILVGYQIIFWLISVDV